MVGNSRSIVAARPAPHPDLARCVRRHCTTVYRRPLAAHTEDAFAALVERLDPALPVVLDAGCGTGESSARLAALHPGAQIVGVDKSAHRLGRAPLEAAPRVLLLRADLQDFWRLACAARWRPLAHYLLYPNPWPKAVHLKRRWHAHPVFPTLLELGGRLELRTNWAVYAREFAEALGLCGIDARIESFRRAPGGAPLTPFERKYLASGQACLRLTADLDGAGAAA